MLELAPPPSSPAPPSPPDDENAEIEECSDDGSFEARFDALEARFLALNPA